jgi:hypothetical protein
MLSDLKEIFPIFVNFVVPIFAGLVYFAMAIYVKHIGPMRTLVTGELTYKGAYWGFLIFGVYLATRPIQILFPHPWPLIVNNLRELCMIGVFGPAVFIAMMSLVFGSEKLSRRLVLGALAAGILLAVVFMVTNVFAIGGSEEIFRVGSFRAYDGLWFNNPRQDIQELMRILFVVRFIDPVLVIFAAGTLVFWHAKTYPEHKRAVYDNMPKKLYYLGAACYMFSLSMLSVGLLYLFAHIPNQWWIYYVGALAAGLLETISLSLPLRKEVQVSEHL